MPTRRRSSIKTHVVWDVSPAVRDSFKNTSPEDETINDAEADVSTNASSKSIPDFDSMLSSQEDDLEAQVINENGLFPLMEKMSRIEYYSSTNADWICATLSSNVVHERKDASSSLQGRLAYKVFLPRDQEREDVPVDCFRRPFSEGEPVEIFSNRLSGVWIPGSIVGKQSPGATTIGYRVKVEGDGEDEGMILDHVPPRRLRRWFPPGCLVYVYRGPQHGWQEAVVHQDAVVHALSGPAACAEHPSNQPPNPLGPFSPRSGPTRADSNQNALVWWTHVPVCVEGPDTDPEWVPSYFVHNLVTPGKWERWNVLSI